MRASELSREIVEVDMCVECNETYVYSAYIGVYS